MRLLSFAFPRARRLLRHGGGFTLAVFGALVALEFAGRQTASDLHDGLAAGLLILVVLLVALRHRSAPLGWVRSLSGVGAWLARVADRYKIEIGLDLRGKPPIPRRLPGLFLALVGLLAAWGGLALAAWYFFPEGWRQAGTRFFYVGYLAGLTLLWAALLTALLVGLYFPIALIHQSFAQPAHGDARVGRSEAYAITLYLLAVLGAAWYLPLGAVPAVCAVALLAMAVVGAWPSRAEVQFLWRVPGRFRVWSVPSVRLVMCLCVLLSLFLVDLILTAAGGRVLGSAAADATMPVTVLLGTALAWLVPGLLVAGLVKLVVLWWNNPARPAPPSVHVAGELSPARRRRVRRVFRRWGWAARFAPDRHESIDVRIRVVEPAQSQATEFEPSWPLRVSLEDLEAGAVRERFERRDEIQKRRLLLRAFERLFKYASGRRFRGGTGFWLAPHLWIVTGLTRDDTDDRERDDAALLLRTVGPPYHRLLHRAVRQYLYRVLRALEVDLIFVEDGVGFRKLAKVLRVLFEVYDRHGGQRRAEEVQFRGIPRLRVLIHEFQLDEPFRSANYPEPRFEDLGRARILHVFRDRGENEEPVEPPFDFSRSPAPVMAG